MSTNAQNFVYISNKIVPLQDDINVYKQSSTLIDEKNLLFNFFASHQETQEKNASFVVYVQKPYF
jgi:hypothetical protein